MTALDNIRRLARYSAWAHDRLLQALEALPEDVVTRDGGGSGSIVKMMNHMLVVDRIWQANLQGLKHGYTARNTPELPALAELAAAQREINAWLVTYAEQLTAERCEEVVPFTYVSGESAELSRGDMLLHVVNHKTYHRGNVAEMMYLAKRKPPTIDLNVYLKEAAG